MENKTKREFGCTDCAVYNCKSKDKEYPSFCHTTKVGEEEKAEIADIYGSDTIDGKMAMTAAQIEGRYYCQKTRVEETILFIQGIGAKKVGIATCAGLINEAKIFAKMLQKNNIEYVSVLCKVGGVDKCEMGLDPQDKIKKGQPETMCNPILQARVLNEAKTDLNISIGLCVGHDALFNKHSQAPVTTLIAKDRVLGHNPVAAIYSNYYRHLFE